MQGDGLQFPAKGYIPCNILLYSKGYDPPFMSLFPLGLQPLSVQGDGLQL
jgi:hypothetical protein